MSSLSNPWLFEGAPAIMAHRGWASQYPENSLQAMEKALELGLRLVEFDVQFSSDAAPMVFHDETLERCSMEEGRIMEAGEAQLSQTLLRHSEIDECIPRLSDAVALFRANPESIAVVEIKEQTLLQFGREEVMGKLLAELAPIEAQTVLISFDLESVRLAQSYYRSRESGGRVGWVLRNYDEASREALEELQPEFVIVNKDKVLGELWSGSWHWMAYEIETEAQAKEWREKGLSLVESKKGGELLESELFSTS